MQDGSLVTVYRDSNIFYILSLHSNIDDKYIMVLIDFRNKGDIPITVYPESFQLQLTAPVNKSFMALDSGEVAKEMEKRGKGGRFFRTFIAGMSRNSTLVDTRSEGDVRISDATGNTATGAYSGSSKSTISSPDYEARERARAKNDAEKARNSAKADHFESYALKANTLRKDETTGGVVFFKKDKFSPGAILSFTIDNVRYEVPYGSERSK